VAIEGESSEPLETPIRTDGDGVAKRLIRSSDTVSISSLVPGIEFTPVTGDAMTLYLGGTLDIAASRLVESESICRQVNSIAEEEVLYRYFNVTDTTIEVVRDDFMNSIVRADGTPAAVQAPESYSSGPGAFSIPMEAFRGSDPSAVVVGGTWKFLGSEQNFSFNPSTEGNPIPLCESEIVDSCRPLADSHLQQAVTRAQQEIFALFSYVARLQMKTRGQTVRLPYQRTGAKALRSIIATIRPLNGRVYSCPTPPPGCNKAEFPSAELGRTFRTIFGESPPALAARVERFGKKARKRYGQHLSNQFPPSVYVCK
jgi:hypothetical protein